MCRGFESLQVRFVPAWELQVREARKGRNMVGLAQLVSASDCGSEGRGFESHHPPSLRKRLRGQVVRRNRVSAFIR